MNCKEVRLYIYEYIHDELDEEKKIAIKEHLLVCNACRNEYEEVSRMLSVVPRVEEIPPMNDLRDRIIYKTINTPFNLSIRRIATAVALFLVGVGSFFAVKRFIPQKPTYQKMDYYIIEGKEHNYIKPVRGNGGNIYFIPAGYDKGPF